MSRSIKLTSLFRLAGGVCLLLVLCVNVASAELIVPPATTEAFIQTTGPNGALGIGDYRANAAGDNDDHVLSVFIACVPGVTYFFEIFDPAVEVAGNATALDEIRPDPPATAADDTTFFVEDPVGGVVGAAVTYTPGTSANAWTTLATLGPTGVADCGEYELHSRTSQDDENGWRFRLTGDNAGTPFEGDAGPDGVLGTGDEAFVVLSAVSYQHRDASPQSFYWFSQDGDTDMFMLTFDMDNNINTRYIAPDGTITQGTPSGSTVWNNAVPQQARPTFAQMVNCSGGAPCDAFDSPMPGLWEAEISVNLLNQYSFEVPGRQLFLAPPPLPDVVISKFDGVSTVTSPGTNTYTIRIENIGEGAAMPLPGPEVVDTLPAGMTFVSCTVNAPLVGTCASVGNTIEFQLDPQTGSRGYLLGSGAGAGRIGTMTVTTNIAAGLPDGTQLINTATVDFTDLLGNDHAPRSATDPDRVGVPAPVVPTAVVSNDASPALALVDPFITKRVEPPFALPGEPATWFITVTNPGSIAVNNISITDQMPAEVEILSVTTTTGSASFSGQTVSFTLSSLAPGASATITVNTRVRPGVATPFAATNRACMSADNAASECATATLTSVSSLPATGESPTLYYAAVLVFVLLLANGLLLVKGEQRA